jgi:hypothetical protein
MRAQPMDLNKRETQKTNPFIDGVCFLLIIQKRHPHRRCLF